MRTESMKLLAGVLALRLFTIEELSAFSNVKPATASSWLNRKRSFVRIAGSAPRGERGRPPNMYEIQPDGEERILEVLSAIPARAVEAAFGRAAHDAPARLEALERAQTYRQMTEEATDEADRASAREWFCNWVAVARRQADGFANAEVPVDSRDLALLAAFEGLARRIGEPEPVEAAGLAASVLAMARRCLAEAEAGLRVFVDANLLYEAREGDGPTGVGPLGVLAALGLSGKLSVSPDVRRSIWEAAGSIGLEPYRAGLVALFDRPSSEPLAEKSMLAVINGVRKHKRLMCDGDTAALIGRVIEREGSCRHLPGAYAMLRLEMPGVRTDELVGLVGPWLEAAGAADGCVTGGGEERPDRIGQAIMEVAQEADEFGQRVIGIHRTASPQVTDVQRFTQVFSKPGPLRSVEEFL